MPRTMVGVVMIALLALHAKLGARAQDIAQPVPMDASCAALEEPAWNEQEKFVWGKVCRGEEADFNDNAVADKFGGELFPGEADNWPASRTLTSRFLETILLKDKYRSALTRRGVRIAGARFVEGVDLENAELRHELRLDRSVLNEVNLSGLRSSRLIGFGNSVAGALFLSGAQIDGDLVIVADSKFTGLDLSSTTVHGAVRLSEAHVSGNLNGDGLTADSISIEGGEFGKVRGKVSFVRIAVKGNVSLQGPFGDGVDLTGARIDGDLNLAAGNFSRPLDLTGLQIGGEFRLTWKEMGVVTRWSPDLEDAGLVLRNAKADRIPDICEPWPTKFDLEGFTYRSGGLVPQGNVCPGDDTQSPALETWLGKLQSPSLQPYEQLASVLQSQGDVENAKVTRYTAREQERKHSGSWRWLGLTILKYFIGYGYYLEWAFVPVIFFLIVGIAVMRFSGQDVGNNLPRWAIAYTFDMLLPVVRLRDSHYEINLKGWAEYYFYLHKIMGYVLASVLIAAVAGLTK